jgi:exonuclease 3'-5' domain-containing protein 1
MELSTRTFSKKYVAGLAECIQNCDTISSAVKAEWQLSKDGASRLYDPKKGGRYEIFNERLMKPEIVQYCARDVALLPELWNVYSARLRAAGQAFWRVK